MKGARKTTPEVVFLQHHHGLLEAVDARMQHRQSFLTGDAGEADVVGDQRVRVVADGERGREVNRIEAAHLRIGECSRSCQHQLVQTNQDETVEDAVGSCMSCSRPARATERAMHLDASQRRRDAIGPALQRRREGLGLGSIDDELDES